MKQRFNLFKIFGFILLSLFVLLAFCEKKEEVSLEEQPSVPDTTIVESQPTEEQGQIEIQEKIDALIQLIRENEAKLKATQQALEDQLIRINEKQEQLLEIEAKLKTFQYFSLIVLVIGLFAIILGMVMIFRRKKEEGKKEPAKKPEAKKQKKEEPLENKKEAEKEKAPKTPGRGKRKTPEK